MDTPRKETPLLFNAPMVRAILEGRKTQTRRIWKLPKWAEWDETYGGEKDGRIIPNNPAHRGWYSVDEVACPYGQPGDLIWVKEPWRIGEDVGEGWYPGAFTGDLHLIYDSDGYRDYRSFPADYRWPRNAKETHNSEGTDEHWISYGPIPSIFMPRWASRLLLEVVSVRVERLQDISEEDVLAEGFLTREGKDAFNVYGSREFFIPEMLEKDRFGRVSPGANACPKQAYRKLWNEINGPGSWDANPWVWAINFKPIGGAQ